MRILCWNMQHKRASWRFLSERRECADVALLQEACTAPPDVAARLDVGPGPWIHKGWKGARAVVGLSERTEIERVPVADIMARRRRVRVPGIGEGNPRRPSVGGGVARPER